MARSVLLVVLFALATSSWARADVANATTRFQQTSAQNAAAMHVLQDNAADCGMIGSRVADRMEAALKIVATHERQVAAALEISKTDKAKAVSLLSQIAAAIDHDNADLKSNHDVVMYGLSTDSPMCKLAESAFVKMSKLSLDMPTVVHELAAAL